MSCDLNPLHPGAHDHVPHPAHIGVPRRCCQVPDRDGAHPHGQQVGTGPDLRPEGPPSPSRYSRHPHSVRGIAGPGKSSRRCPGIPACRCPHSHPGMSHRAGSASHERNPAGRRARSPPPERGNQTNIHERRMRPMQSAADTGGSCLPIDLDVGIRPAGEAVNDASRSLSQKFFARHNPWNDRQKRGCPA